eukprot:PhF_6_TR40957/c0_g1_i5/m.61995
MYSNAEHANKTTDDESLALSASQRIACHAKDSKDSEKTIPMKKRPQATQKIGQTYAEFLASIPHVSWPSALKGFGNPKLPISYNNNNDEYGTLCHDDLYGDAYDFRPPTAYRQQQQQQQPSICVTLCPSPARSTNRRVVDVNEYSSTMNDDGDGDFLPQAPPLLTTYVNPKRSPSVLLRARSATPKMKPAASPPTPLLNSIVSAPPYGCLLGGFMCSVPQRKRLQPTKVKTGGLVAVLPPMTSSSVNHPKNASPNSNVT